MSDPFPRRERLNDAKFMRLCEQMTRQNGFLAGHGEAITKLLREQIKMQKAINDLAKKQAETQADITNMGEDVDDHSFQLNRHEILIQGIQGEVERLKTFRQEQERISTSLQRPRRNPNNGSSKPRVTCNTCGSEITAAYLPKHLNTKKCQNMKTKSS